MQDGGRNMPASRDARNRVVVRLVGYWYLCLGLAFVMLGWRSLLAGAAMWTVVLRWIVALGFLILGALSLGFGKPK